MVAVDQSLNQSSLSSSFVLAEPSLPQNLYQNNEPPMPSQQNVHGIQKVSDHNLPYRIDLKVPEEANQQPTRRESDALADNVLSPNRAHEDHSLINF